MRTYAELEAAYDKTIEEMKELSRRYAEKQSDLNALASEYQTLYENGVPDEREGKV